MTNAVFVRALQGHVDVSGFEKFQEKRKHQVDKRRQTVKSMFTRKSQYTTYLIMTAVLQNIPLHLKIFIFNLIL